MDRRQSLTIRKGKRFRSAFTTDQVNYLEKEFKKFPYIGTAHRKEVANALNIHERAVKIWFQNRRMKEKKDVGNKDQESDDQATRKNIGFVNDKLNNVIAMPSANDPCYSLPQLTVPVPNTSSNLNINKDIAKIDSIAAKSEPLKLNYYNDISPEREIAKVTYPSSTPPLPNSQQINYRSSAEFSIDLCKKYRNNFPIPDVQKMENNNFPVLDPPQVDNHKQVHISPPYMYPREEFPKVEHQSLPEDLSCKTSMKKIQESDQSPPKNMDPSGPGYIPFYVNYPQPYLSAGNMLWKPVNVLPIMSTGVSAVNISSNQSGSLSVSQEQSIPRKKCNCDCHLELPPALPLPANSPNPQAQYVITALPFQNYPKF